MSNNTQVFDCVENGEITAQNIRRGGVFRGKRLGRLSPDSTYLSLDLYPVTGAKPNYDNVTQVLTGPVHAWDSVNKVVRLTYVVTDIDRQVILSRIKEEIKSFTQRRLDEFAFTREYRSIGSASGYAGSHISRFNDEGVYCKRIESETWSILYNILEAVEVGTRDIPTGFAEIESELPVLRWPT